MAKSPAHRFGQIIGDLLEEAMREYCTPIAKEHGLYLDYKHKRPARNGKKEIKWEDIHGNMHKLDIVMEQGGTEDAYGRPKVFIEVAWRRYTKHAKAQEISAAITPLVAKYCDSSPFFGAVLAGEFTQTSLQQMRSEGFEVLHFPTRMIEEIYREQGIDAHWDESTSEEELQKRVDILEAMREEDRNKLKKALIDAHETQWNAFVEKLNHAIERNVENVRVLALYGESQEFASVADACEFITTEPEEGSGRNLCKYEICVSFSNGDKIGMQFKEKNHAAMFLKQLET